MASIMYLAKRRLPWRGQVKRKGQPKLIKHFLTRDEAEHWAGEQERNIRLAGLPLTVNSLAKHLVREIFERYRDEITPTKAGGIYETSRLNRFLNKKPGSDLAAKSLAYVSKRDGYDYVRERQRQAGKQGNLITARTISRERNLFQDVFEIAKERWGYSNLVNPFRGLKIKGSKHRRARRLEEGEEFALLAASSLCHGANKFYVPLAIDLAIATGMREQELFNLTWNDVDIERRKLTIRKSKTDHLKVIPGRVIPLTWSTLVDFARVRASAPAMGARNSDSSRVFPMTQGAFMQTWSGVIRRAGIANLQYRDLRHEAASRFDEAGLTRSEIKLMLGHSSGDTTDLYINSDINRIREKIERHTMRSTFDEYFSEELASGSTIKKILNGILDAKGITVSSEEEGQELNRRVEQIERRENRLLKPKEMEQLLADMRKEKAKKATPKPKRKATKRAKQTRSKRKH